MQSPASKGRNFVQPAWEKVIDLRNRKGWTQDRLAEKSRVSVRTIQNIERGKPTQFGTILKLAQALGVQAQECMLPASTQSDSRDILTPTSVDGHQFSAPACPYRGLLPFREEDSKFFFGREHLIQVLEQTLSESSIVQVSGASGSGKSSLIAAGLIPALRKSKSGQVLYCRPGTDPFKSMAALLIPHLEPELDEITRAGQLSRLALVLQEGQLGYLLERLLLIQGKSWLLLFIDQFEELYTQCNSQEIRQRFLDSLLALASAVTCAGRPAVKLIYALRADFIHRLLSHRGFTDAIQSADVKIGPMNREELDCVIRKPALWHGVRFEDGLVQRILSEAGKEPGSLPLLEFTLTELWERQADQALTHAAYEQIGQLSGAIANRAETVYRRLTPPQQEAAQQILARLVRLADEGGEDTRQRVTVAALCGQEQLNTDAGRKVLETLTEARLVTLGLGDDLRQETVEIAHEALIRRWPRLNQWLHEHRQILIWRQRLRFIIQEWQQAGRDDGFLLRGPLLDEARLWLSHRTTDLTRTEKDFIDSSIAFHKKERANRPIASLELLMENSGSEVEIDAKGVLTAQQDTSLLEKLPFLRRPGIWRLQLNIVPVASGHIHALRSQLPQVPIADFVSLFSSAARTKVAGYETTVLPDDLETAPKIDDETFALLRRLQLMGASSLALELVTPQLDEIRDPPLRLKFASIVFDMMHVRGRYEDAAELIQQELAMHAETTHLQSPLLLPLKIRLLHHKMFYRPVSELWPEMLDLLARCGPEDNAGACGEILFMLGGNLGTLRGDYDSARRFLVRAIRYAQRRKDDYLLARCLRKYGDYLRYRGHLRLSNSVLSEALSLSVGPRGTRQRVYVLGCLGDLERQKLNYSASREYFETAVDLAKAAFIPGWLGNLHLGLAEIAIERNLLDEARGLLDQAEAHYRKTRPKHWWGEIQVGLGRSRLMRSAGEPGWIEAGQAAQGEAIAAGYQRDAAFASKLLEGSFPLSNVLMFL